MKDNLVVVWKKGLTAISFALILSVSGCSDAVVEEYDASGIPKVSQKNADEIISLCIAEDGSFQYLSNKILNEGIMHIPDYQYRIKELRR